MVWCHFDASTTGRSKFIWVVESFLRMFARSFDKMSLKEFKTFISDGAIDFYINEAGLITCDEIHHKSLYQTFIVYYWNKYEAIVGPRKLYKVLESLDDSSVLQFDSKGQLVNPPLGIYNLLLEERRRETITSLLAIRFDPTFPVVVLFGILLLYTIRRLALADVIRLNLKRGFDGDISGKQQGVSATST